MPSSTAVHFRPAPESLKSVRWMEYFCLRRVCSFRLTCATAGPCRVSEKGVTDERTFHDTEGKRMIGHRRPEPPRDPSGSGKPDAAQAPLLSVWGLALAVLSALVLCWPMLLVTAPLGYPDTEAYVQTGGRVVGLALDLLPLPATASAEMASTGHSDAQTEAASARQLRSFVYSAFLYLGSLVPGGLVAATVMQTAATLLVLFAFVTATPRPIPAWPGVLFLVALTPLPWIASYAMPDILAAAVVLYYALIVAGVGHIGMRWRVALGAIASFAIVSHYGHLPLAFVLMVASIAVCALRRCVTGAGLTLAALPFVLAVGVNVVASAATLDGPSVAPKRLPILLARSIDDGPAAWHLAEACPRAGYAICSIFPGGVPSDITAFLWSDAGIARATADELDAIRAEEARILWNAFRAYPVEQLTSLFGNVGMQLVSIGTEEVNPLVAGSEAGRFVATRQLRDGYPALALFDSVTFWATLSAFGIAGLAWARGAMPQGAGWVLGLCLFGLFFNAAIFGGLSAPVDRYQSRVAWVFPALALVCWLNRRNRTPEQENI